MNISVYVSLNYGFSGYVPSSGTPGSNGSSIFSFFKESLPPDGKRRLTGKDTGARKDWRQEEKGTTEDKMVGWRRRLNGHEFEQAPGVGDGQGSLVCCSPWGHKESDTTDWTVTRNLRTLLHAGCINLTFSPTVQEGSLFSIPSPAFMACRFFNDGHPGWCEVIPHCSFNLYFYNNKQCWVSFHVFIGHLYVFFGEMSI